MPDGSAGECQRGPFPHWPATAGELRQSLLALARGQVEATVRRYLPDLIVPTFFAGFRQPPREPVLLGLMARLYELGERDVAGHPLPDAMVPLLERIDGAGVETFSSFRLAEAVLTFGPVESNPLVARLSSGAREQLARAVDSTHIYDQWDKPLGGRPSNYWAVLARCELRRRQLGLLRSPAILDEAVDRVEQLLSANPRGFVDDSRDGRGRYDIYSAETLMFAEPLWPTLDADVLARSLSAHVALLASAGLRGGASVAYGRSVGVLSLCVTLELAALGVRQGLADDPGRLLGLAANAAAAIADWFSDDLINAHRGRSTFGYRGPHRLLSMTLDTLGKLLTAAEMLDDIPADQPVAGRDRLFPPVDALIRLDDRSAGLWVFRDGPMEFQLPMVDGAGADYVAMPRGPGWLENPVDSGIVCHVPRIVADGREYLPCGLPAAVEKTPGGLTVHHDGFRAVGKGAGDVPPLPGRREARYHVEGDVLHLEEILAFESGQLPQAISITHAETSAGLDWRIDTDARVDRVTIPVGGISAWRSFWGELRTCQQAQIAPAETITLRHRLRRV